MYNSPLQRHGRIGNLEESRVLENTLNAATIRNHEQIRGIAKPQEEGELPKATYHRQCRSIFTLERNLDELSQLDAKERENCNSTDSRRSSIRQPTANPGRIYQRVCIFCEKDKYTRNSRTREEQCVDMQCTLMKRSGRLLQENVITESWLSSPESLWLLKRAP